MVVLNQNKQNKTEMDREKLKEAFDAGRNYEADLNKYSGKPIHRSTESFTKWYNKQVKKCDLADVSSNRFVSSTCKGEKCSVCGKNATNKLGEEIPYDDPNPNRHNLTAYVCREHFRMIVGRLG